jgi:hypothetical protein
VRVPDEEGNELAQNYEEQAAGMRAQAAERIPAPFMEAAQALVEDLERTVVAEGLNTGDLAPDFTLKQAGDGTQRSLSDALANGPVVLSFYRGQW